MPGPSGREGIKQLCLLRMEIEGTIKLLQMLRKFEGHPFKEEMCTQCQTDLRTFGFVMKASNSTT